MAFNLFKKKGKNEPKSRPERSRIHDAQSASGAPQAENAGPSVQVAIGTSVLKNFHVSEKSSRGQAYNHYTFVVASSATKSDIKHAVQRAFKVDVADVHIIRLPSKKRRIGRWEGTKSGLKKAVVALKAGQTIAQAQP